MDWLYGWLSCSQHLANLESTASRGCKREREIIFDEALFYDPDLPLPQDIPVCLPDPQPFHSVQIPPAVLEADNEVAGDAVQDSVDDSQPAPPDHGIAAADEQTCRMIEPN